MSPNATFTTWPVDAFRDAANISALGCDMSLGTVLVLANKSWQEWPPDFNLKMDLNRNADHIMTNVRSIYSFTLHVYRILGYNRPQPRTQGICFASPYSLQINNPGFQYPALNPPLVFSSEYPIATTGVCFYVQARHLQKHKSRISKWDFCTQLFALVFRYMSLSLCR